MFWDRAISLHASRSLRTAVSANLDSQRQDSPLDILDQPVFIFNFTDMSIDLNFIVTPPNSLVILPPFKIDLANATALDGGEVEVVLGLGFETTVSAIAHLPFTSLKLNEAVQQMTGATHVWKQEVCGWECSICNKALSPHKYVAYNSSSRLAAHPSCVGQCGPSSDSDNDVSGGYLVKVGSKLYCFGMVGRLN